MSTPTLDLDVLSTLARQLVEAGLPDEAAELLEMGLRLEPSNMAVQLALAQVKQLTRRPPGGGPRGIEQTLREQLRRSALDAKHFLGLAYLYLDRGEEERVLEYLEIAAERDLPNPAIHKLHAKLLLKRGDYRRAVPQLKRARRYNPFDRETCELLGAATTELGDHAAALASWVDAFLLLPTSRRQRSFELKQHIQEARDRLGWHNDDLAGVFRQRQEELRVAFDRLEWHRQRFQEEPRLTRLETLSPTRHGRIDLAARLRHLDVWSHLSDEQIFQVAAAVHEEERRRGERLFEHGSDGADLYVVEKGEVTIQRPTPYGTFPLGLVKPGELFGEVNFITRAERSGTAVASQPTQLLRLGADELERIVAGNPELGVQLYWSFWHGLAFKLRCTNEQLRTFFAEEEAGEAALELRRSPAEGRQAEVAAEDKEALLREQGLSGPELAALARFSRERSYPGGSWIFREGEQGREMFVVLDGQVRISKMIPGAGEEALAILGRGDFFGEMALIDGQPRSADARAHQGPATVIALAEETIRTVLSRDPVSSLQFLRLLCRLVANRLREIDEKVIGWRIMAGQPPTSATA